MEAIGRPHGPPIKELHHHTDHTAGVTRAAVLAFCHGLAASHQLFPAAAAEQSWH